MQCAIGVVSDTKACTRVSGRPGTRSRIEAFDCCAARPPTSLPILARRPCRRSRGRQPLRRPLAAAVPDCIPVALHMDSCAGAPTLAPSRADKAPQQGGDEAFRGPPTDVTRRGALVNQTLCLMHLRALYWLLKMDMAFSAWQRGKGAAATIGTTRAPELGLMARISQRCAYCVSARAALDHSCGMSHAALDRRIARSFAMCSQSRALRGPDL